MFSDNLKRRDQGKEENRREERSKRRKDKCRERRQERRKRCDILWFNPGKAYAYIIITVANVRLLKRYIILNKRYYENLPLGRYCLTPSVPSLSSTSQSRRAVVGQMNLILGKTR